MRRDTTGQRRQPREERPITAGTITQVQATQRDPERVSVFIDGVFALALPAIVAVQRGLRSGVELDEAAVRELEGLAEAERATEAAVTFVAYRPRSEREVREGIRHFWAYCTYLDDLTGDLAHNFQLYMRNARVKFEGLSQRIGDLNPTAILKRGYSITAKAGTGAVVTDAAAVSAGEALSITLHRGGLDVSVVNRKT